MKKTTLALILSAIAIAIGIILIPICLPVAIVLFAASAAAFIVLLIHWLSRRAKTIKAPKKEHEQAENDEEEAARSSCHLDWWKLLLTVLTVAILLIVILLLCRGCGKDPKTVVVKNPEKVVIDNTPEVKIGEVDGDVKVDKVDGDVNVGETKGVNVETTEKVEIGEAKEVKVDKAEKVEVNDPEEVVINDPEKEEEDEDPQPTPHKDDPKPQKDDPQPAHVCKEATTRTVEATCTKAGKVEHICSCGKVLKTDVVPAKGHDWDNGELTTPATEDNEGVKTYTCTRCGEQKTEKVEKLPKQEEQGYITISQATVKGNSFTVTVKYSGNVKDLIVNQKQKVFTTKVVDTHTLQLTAGDPDVVGKVYIYDATETYVVSCTRTAD